MYAVVIFSLRGLTRRPLQTALLLFALSIALAGTMTMMALLSGIREQVRRDLEQVGLDVINVNVSPNLIALLFTPLRLADCDWMKEITGGIVAPFQAGVGVAKPCTPEASGDKPAAIRVPVLETTPEWGQVVQLKLLEGRFFRADESGVCVLDEWVADKLFPGSHAEGRAISVGRAKDPEEFRVVGVFKDPFEIRKRFDELDVTGSARSSMVRMMEFKGIYVPGAFSRPEQPIHGAVVKAPAGTDPIQFERPLRQRLGDRAKSVDVWARKQWIGAMLEVTDFTTMIANVIWVIVLLITGVMITTVSLVAIRERYREIAIRRTEGARRVQIVGQLLAENLMLSFLAGLAALGLSKWAAAVLEARYISWPPAFLLKDMALSLGLGILLGALATVLPAFRAASLDPVEVLRTS